jgi:hypothetical protein
MKETTVDELKKQIEQQKARIRELEIKVKTLEKVWLDADGYQK